VAGIVASAMNNARGGVGVAPAVRLMILRVSEGVRGVTGVSERGCGSERVLGVGDGNG
jgi:hypothetical protein